MMEAGAIARFGGVTAYGDKFHGTGFHLVDLSGWLETPDVRGENVPRPAGHGRFSLPMYLDERVVRMSGFHVAEDHRKWQHEATAIRGLLLTKVTLTIENPLGTFYATGRVTEAGYVPQGFSPEGNWAVTVECDDPRVYGDVHDFEDEPAVNYGNFPARPVLVVSGSRSGGYTVTGPGGRRVVVSRSLASSAPHSIDFARGGLYVRGVRQSRAITVYEPWTVDPGLPGVSATVSNGLTLVQQVTDTYV